MMHRKVNSLNALETILAVWLVDWSSFSFRELDVLFFGFWWADHYRTFLVFSVFVGKLFLATLEVDDLNNRNAWFMIFDHYCIMILDKLWIYVVLLWGLRRRDALLILDWLLYLAKEPTHVILVEWLFVTLAAARAFFLHFSVLALKTRMLWGFRLPVGVYILSLRMGKEFGLAGVLFHWIWCESISMYLNSSSQNSI